MKNLQQLLVASMIVFFAACTSPNSNVESEKALNNNTDIVSEELITEVLTEEKQKALSCNEILSLLMEGNHHFTSNHMVHRDNVAQLNQLLHEQHPEAVVLSCIDSRVPVEQIFDQGIGDLFVVRVAGNINNVDNLASLEYSCKVSGAKVIIVMGHENCGAVKSAVKGVELGNITELLTHIQPAIDKHLDYKGEQSIENDDFLELITKENAILTLNDIRKNSPILKEMEEHEEIKLIAAYFDLHTGEVILL